MNIAKRIIPIILVLIMLFSLFGCGEYHYAQTGGGKKPGGNTGGGVEQPEMNNDPTDDFVVTLTVDGAPYVPRTEMSIYWSDGFSVHAAPVNNMGEARIDGLDGDYRITVNGLPNDFTYNPNGSIATNDDRVVEVPLYPLTFLAGGGTGIYDCYKFKHTGVYCAVIENPGDGIFFEYAPTGNGVYTIESWIDISADSINPYVDVYYGSTQWKAYEKTTDDGGPMGSYTINFVHTVSIAEENISQGGGQAVYTFAVKAESKNNNYPIIVTFAVKRNGGFELNYAGKVYGTAIPTYDFDSHDASAHEYGSEYKISYPYYTLAGQSNTRVFDDRTVKLWKKSHGGDDFYHVYDLEKYPETGGYGPILYAYITKPTQFIDAALFGIEYKGGDPTSGETINGDISSVGGLNYKHFIEGYTQLATYGNINGGSYYCVSDCPCHANSGSNEGWACVDGCTTCNAACRNIPEELVGCEGYQSIANSDGLVPVTEELKVFLDEYCKKKTFFFDGKGYIDMSTVGGYNYQAVGDSGWLFACAYYEEK